MPFAFVSSKTMTDNSPDGLARSIGTVGAELGRRVG